MNYKYHVVYFFNKGIGSIEINSSVKIDNYESIKNIEKIIKDKNNIDGNVILVNWIKLRTTANVRFRWLKAIFTQISKLTSHSRKRCVKFAEVKNENRKML